MEYFPTSENVMSHIPNDVFNVQSGSKYCLYHKYLRTATFEVSNIIDRIRSCVKQRMNLLHPKGN